MAFPRAVLTLLVPCAYQQCSAATAAGHGCPGSAFGDEKHGRSLQQDSKSLSPLPPAAPDRAERGLPVPVLLARALPAGSSPKAGCCLLPGIKHLREEEDLNQPRAPSLAVLPSSLPASPPHSRLLAPKGLIPDYPSLACIS